MKNSWFQDHKRDCDVSRVKSCYRIIHSNVKFKIKTEINRVKWR